MPANPVRAGSHGEVRALSTVLVDTGRIEEIWRLGNDEGAVRERQFLLRKGTSPEYGARELKRTIHRFLTQPLATLVAAGKIEPGARVRVEVAEDKESLSIRTLDHAAVRAPQHPTVLLVDDNRDLLRFLERLMAQAGWRLLTAESAQQAQEVIADQAPNAALLDYLLPDGNGVELGCSGKRLRCRSSS